MAHKFTQHVFHPTNGSFLHTSCESCGVVVGQSDKPCPHPVAPPAPASGIYPVSVDSIELFPSVYSFDDDGLIVFRLTFYILPTL